MNMDVFITTCSMNKKGGGKSYRYYDWKNDGRGELIKYRRNVLELMRSGAIKSSMKLPAIGPDFGGIVEEAEYLPAIKRYSQGAFVEGLKASSARLAEWNQENRLYFISGLYGIAYQKEPIQNYDLDLYQDEVRSLWEQSALITTILLADIRWHREKVGTIFNCCANETYHKLIDWNMLINNGFNVKHAVSSGQFTGRQVRWACGHLAGAAPERLLDMILYEESQYTSDNGSIRFVKELLPISRIEGGKQFSSASQIREAEMDSVAVACLREGQYARFLDHARKRGWDRLARFELIPDLARATIKKFDEHGFKMLIVHVDETHAEVRKAYKVRSFDAIDYLPRDWQYRKVTNESYSDIQLISRLSFKID